MRRYRAIIDDWEAFRRACARPARVTIRRNPLKAGPDFEDRLRSEFPGAHPSEWHPDIYRLSQVENPGRSLLHWLGEFYVQEESAALPVEVLEPRPGESILDMCAAPGGKTTQIAAKVGNVGKIVANDVSAKRLRSLEANLYRTGCTCVAVTHFDGRWLPEHEKFDRILVDAPCTGEAHKARRDFSSASLREVHRMARLQKRLVLKASRLLTKGGVLVYSTCTFAPEENEEVVEYAVERAELKLERVDLPVPHQRGITSFEGKEYLTELEKTVRVYPHHLKSGGIFIARLRR